VLVAAAVCPHPPLIVPELAAGAAAELHEVRAACDEALRRLVNSEPDLVVAVGPDAKESGVRELAADVRGSFLSYGVDISIGANPARKRQLPLSLSVGAWLLQRSSWDGARCFVAVGGDTDVNTCLSTGKHLALRGERIAFLVLGDGSARRSENAPGYVDDRAALYDEDIRRALQCGDVSALAELDPTLAADLLVSGRPAWQVLAGAAQDVDVTAALLAHEAPYGVAYFVASWTVR
jgi:hypothetical protein